MSFFYIKIEPPNIKVFSLWNDSINFKTFYCFGNKIHIRKPRQTQVVKIKTLRFENTSHYVKQLMGFITVIQYKVNFRSVIVAFCVALETFIPPAVITEQHL